MENLDEANDLIPRLAGAISPEVADVFAQILAECRSHRALGREAAADNARAIALAKEHADEVATLEARKRALEARLDTSAGTIAGAHLRLHGRIKELEKAVASRDDIIRRYELARRDLAVLTPACRVQIEVGRDDTTAPAVTIRNDNVGRSLKFCPREINVLDHANRTRVRLQAGAVLELRGVWGAMPEDLNMGSTEPLRGAEHGKEHKPVDLTPRRQGTCAEQEASINHDQVDQADVRDRGAKLEDELDKSVGKMLGDADREFALDDPELEA